jgi:hypothetical protein
LESNWPPIWRTRIGCITPWDLIEAQPVPQRARVHPGAGLVFAGRQFAGGQHLEFALVLRVVVCIAAEEGVEAAAEAFEFGRCHGGVG